MRYYGAGQKGDRSSIHWNYDLRLHSESCESIVKQVYEASTNAGRRILPSHDSGVIVKRRA